MSYAIDPATREEVLLNNIAGGTDEITPATRKEKLLANIGDTVDAIADTLDTTGASQGDVLTVGASGVEWAAPSGGGLAVGGTWTKVGTTVTCTLNKTLGDICDALAGGSSVVINVAYNENVQESYTFLNPVLRARRAYPEYSVSGSLLIVDYTPPAPFFTEFTASTLNDYPAYSFNTGS